MNRPYRIERTKNRHSRAVCRDGVIVIRLASGLPETEARKHTEWLLKRMDVLLAREEKKTKIDPFGELLRGADRMTLHLWNGTTREIVLTAAKRTRVTIDGNAWTIGVGPMMQRKNLHKLLWKTLMRAEGEALCDYVQDLNDDTLRVRIRGLRLRLMRSQWGSCSSRGMIALNAALLVLPEPLLRYVAVHELAHCLVANHSARFWNLVESVLPDFRTPYAKLRNYALPTL